MKKMPGCYAAIWNKSSAGIRAVAVALALSAVLSVWPSVSQADPSADKDTAAWLEFGRRSDGKCQGLNRGKAVTLLNRHPEATITYRLARYLSNRRQAGLTTGSIAPATEDGKGEKMGCELLDGLKQEWRTVRALLADPS